MVKMQSILRISIIFEISVVVLLICNKFGCAHAILNDRVTTTNPIAAASSSTLAPIPSLREGRAHPHFLHAKVSRAEETTTSAQKRRLQLPFPSTAAPPGACDCMGYWECISNNGHVYSYCGISDSEVCCFQQRKIKENVANRNTQRQVIKPTVEFEPVLTSSIPPTSRTTLADTFDTENDTPLNDGNSFITSSLNFEPVSTTPDVDYYYSLEDGVGDLKQITATTGKNSDAEKIARASNFARNYSSSSSCGTQSVNWKLNSKAEFKEWPWHVALLEIHQDVYVCGGALISNKLVVTAAHCVNSYGGRRGASTLKIRAGEYDISTNDEIDPYTEVAVEKIFVHPAFNNATLANDIALVELKRPLNYSSNIRPICLPDDTLLAHSPKACVVTGWGRESEASPFSIVLKEIVVPLWKHDECEDKLQRNFGNSYELVETAICAGERGHDACDGDGGGGLVCYDDQRRRFYLKGITSYGIGCGRLDTPGVYTNVASYLRWIESSQYFL